MDTIISALTSMFCFATGMFLTDYFFRMDDKRREEREELRRARENVSSRYRSQDYEISKTYEETIKGLEKLREINRERMQIMHDQIMRDIEAVKNNLDRERRQATEQANT
jgi:hypothetical protein